MSKTTIALALTAAFMVIVVPAASAAESVWLVAGTRLTGTVALASTAHVSESINLDVPSAGIKLTCTGGSGSVISVVNPFIQGSSSAGAESLILAGCSEIAPASCTIATTIATEPVVASVEYRSRHDRLVVAPKANNLFAGIDFKGCAFEEEPLHGKVVLNMAKGEHEEAEQLVEGLGATENNSLQIDSLIGGAYITGSAQLKLVSGKKFGAFPRVAISGTTSFGKVKVLSKKTEAFKLTNSFENIKHEMSFMESIKGKEAFSIVPSGDTCSKKETGTPGECSIEVEFDPPAKEKFEALLHYPYESSTGTKYKESILLEGEGE